MKHKCRAAARVFESPRRPAGPLKNVSIPGQGTESGGRKKKTPLQRFILNNSGEPRGVTSGLIISEEKKNPAALKDPAFIFYESIFPPPTMGRFMISLSAPGGIILRDEAVDQLGPLYQSLLEK